MAGSRKRTAPPAAAVAWVSGSADDTQVFGARLGAALRLGDVVAFHGELGTGKTTMIQGIAQGLGLPEGRIKSPTFVLMREYPLPDGRLVHIDGYRLDGAPAAAALDLDLMLSPRAITLIEWADRFAGLLPDDHLDIRLEHVSANRRRIALVPRGPRAEALARQAAPAPGASDAPTAPESSDDAAASA